jgi:hypothetical protein
MVHGDGKELWFFVVELLHSEASLHQIQIASESNGTGTSNLICCSVMSAVLGLRLKFDTWERKSKFLVRYSIASAKLVIDKQANGSELVLGEGSLGISERKVRYRFR